MTKKRKPNILFYDIETLPFEIKAFCWDPWNIIKPIDSEIIHPATIVTLAYKWMGESKTHCFIADHKNVRDDKQILIAFSKIMEQADYMVGHYSKKFDTKMVNARLLAHRLPPVAIPHQLDTHQMVKREFLLKWSNKLDYIGKMLGKGGKSSTSWSLWERCTKGEKAAIKEMADYNIRDVELLEEIFLELLPYCPKTLNHKLFGDEACCPSCGKHKLHKRGTLATNTKLLQRLQCVDCSAWSTEIIKEV